MSFLCAIFFFFFNIVYYVTMNKKWIRNAFNDTKVIRRTLARVWVSPARLRRYELSWQSLTGSYDKKKKRNVSRREVMRVKARIAWPERGMNCTVWPEIDFELLIFVHLKSKSCFFFSSISGRMRSFEKLRLSRGLQSIKCIGKKCTDVARRTVVQHTIARQFNKSS